MLISAIRPLALTVLMIGPTTAIAQTVPNAGNPYTAVKKITIIQKLTDGTTLTRESNGTEARDSQGRTMVQTSMAEIQRQSITHTTVRDPIARTMTSWFSQGKQATRFHLPDLHGVSQQSGQTTTGVVSGSIGAVPNETASQTTEIAAMPPGPPAIQNCIPK